MKKLSLSFLLVVFVIASIAQPQIKFDNTTYDFGLIKEQNGKVTGRFEFTNVGTADLLLVKVSPGCGCTAANYTREAVPPGKRGFIDATYDPYNRPGPFHKNIRITTNEPSNAEPNAAPLLLFIKGNVEKRPPTIYEAAGYNEGAGTIRIKERFTRLETSNIAPIKHVVNIKNFSDKKSTITPTNIPPYITIETSFGNALKPNEEGQITLTFDPRKKNQIGDFREIVTFITQDSIEPKITVFLDIHVSEDFSTYSEEKLRMAPVIALNVDNINFGEVAKGSQSVQLVKVFNNGKSPLTIRQVKPSSTMYTVTIDQTQIEPGGSTTLTITFFAKNRAGQQPATIDIITNDPKNPTMNIKVDANISK